MAAIAALGMVETRGLVALCEATDAMLKTADVELLGWRKVGKGLVTAFVAGEVAAVKSAIAAGEAAAAKVGEVTATHIIPRPHEELSGLYPETKVKRGAK
ncbi:MAG: BMC domain-containing protein [Phycisphaerales bacterium]|nr:BMC domain-containing protein [Phycisphaerales bacterium]